MEVYIEVIAMDRENGVKKTIKETVRVPEAVLAVHKMFAEDGDHTKVLTAIAQSVYMGARKELDAGRKNQKVAMDRMVESGGKVGGARAGTTAAGKPDPMAEALGLDLIQHAAQAEGRVPMPQRQPTAPPMQPAQPPMGPGAVGFASSAATHAPGPGPGAIGFPREAD